MSVSTYLPRLVAGFFLQVLPSSVDYVDVLPLASLDRVRLGKEKRLTVSRIITIN